MTTMSLSGTADALALAALESLLSQLHDHVLAAHHKTVLLDFTQLGFINSSCFAKLIAWVHRVRLLPEASAYTIRIRTSEKQTWQRRSLHALKCFAVDVVTIET